MTRPKHERADGLKRRKMTRQEELNEIEEFNWGSTRSACLKLQYCIFKTVEMFFFCLGLLVSFYPDNLAILIVLV